MYDYVYKKYYFIILLLFLVGPLRAETEIDIQYKGSKPAIPRLTRKIIKKNYLRFAKFLGYDKTVRINCIIVSKDTEFAKYMGHNPPPWLAGVMDYRAQRIVLKSPQFKNISHAQYENTIKHELVHFMQNAVVPLAVTPNWFDEGIAEYLAKNHNIRSQIILSQALNNEKLIPLNELQFAFSPNRTQSELAYAESSSLIDFIVIAYGEEIIKNILMQIQHGATFSKAWQATTGMEYKYLDFHWRKYIKKRYKWIFLLDFKYLIWLIMPVLLILAYIIKRITNREIIDEWEEEREYEENMGLSQDDFLEISNNPASTDKSE